MIRPRLTDEVQKILQGRYWSARAQRDKRQREIYAAHPELEALDRRMNAAGYAMLAEAAKNGQYTDASVQAVHQLRKHYLDAHRLRGDYAEVIPFCRACGDTGDLDGSLCACARVLYDALKPRLFDASLNREQTFENADLSLFSDRPAAGQKRSSRAHMTSLYGIAKDYTEHFYELVDRDLIITGPQGRGKTYVLNAIGNALTERGIDVCYVPATQMFSALVEYRKLRESFRPDPEFLENATARKQLIFESSALLIDDLGLEPLTPQTFADFIDVLNTRAQEKRHTIIATNQGYADFERNYDKRIASRLAAFAIYDVVGDDLRIKMRVNP